MAAERKFIDVTPGEEIAAASADMNYDRDIQEALACLQLPRMPSLLHECDGTVKKSPQQNQHYAFHQELPSITVMVCSDIDLKSSSALAEYTLQQKNRVFDANNIDLIIAVGPCAHDSDLQQYCQGGQHRTNLKSRRRMMQQQQARQHQHQRMSPYTDCNAMLPFFRSREESAALEGLMTAAISQLESIVCRVVYCPGWTDPLTVLQPRSIKRLTPNSRNVHQQWLPLAPGLGCAGLFYLDGSDKMVADYRDANYPDEHSNDDDSDASEEQDSMTILSEQLKKLQQCPSGYCSALTKLLQLAPTPEYPEILFRTSGSACKAQTILVTHYIDSLSFQQNDCSTSIDEGACDESCEYSTNDDSSVSATTSDEGSSTESEESIIRSKETASRSPWPIDHDQFLANTSTQQHLCLEIAGGSAAIHPPAWICSTARSKIGGSNQQSAKESSVLLPGSLRERGEFCILQLSLVENKQIESSPRPRFSWEVLQVDFHQVNNFGKA